MMIYRFPGSVEFIGDGDGGSHAAVLTHDTANLSEMVDLLTSGGNVRAIDILKHENGDVGFNVSIYPCLGPLYDCPLTKVAGRAYVNCTPGLFSPLFAGFAKHMLPVCLSLHRGKSLADVLLCELVVNAWAETDFTLLWEKGAENG